MHDAKVFELSHSLHQLLVIQSATHLMWLWQAKYTNWWMIQLKKWHEKWTIWLVRHWRADGGIEFQSTAVFHFVNNFHQDAELFKNWQYDDSWRWLMKRNAELWSFCEPGLMYMSWKVWHTLTCPKILVNESDFPNMHVMLWGPVYTQPVSAPCVTPQMH